MSDSYEVEGEKTGQGGHYWGRVTIFGNGLNGVNEQTDFSFVFFAKKPPLDPLKSDFKRRKVFGNGQKFIFGNTFIFSLLSKSHLHVIVCTFFIQLSTPLLWG